MQWAAIVIALAALVFTLFSFWWMHWRVGHIIVAGPSSYAATTQADALILLFPLVFFNTGPVPYVVRNLRVRFKDEPNGAPLTFQRIRSGVSPSHVELLDLASGFPIPGNQTVKLFCEFGRKPTGRTITAGAYGLVLEALTDKVQGWTPLSEFILHIDTETADMMRSNFVAFENQLNE